MTSIPDWHVLNVHLFLILTLLRFFSLQSAPFSLDYWDYNVDSDPTFYGLELPTGDPQLEAPPVDPQAQLEAPPVLQDDPQQALRLRIQNEELIKENEALKTECKTLR